MHPPIVFGSNLAARDKCDLFTRGELWATSRSLISGYHFAREHILAKEPGMYEVGVNTFPALVAAGAFERVQEWNLKTIIGVGAVGTGDCGTLGHVNQTLEIIRDVHNVGGWVDYLQIDSPISFWHQACHRPGVDNIGAAADAVAFFSNAIKQTYPHIKIGYIDGFGYKDQRYLWTADEMIHFCTELGNKGQYPEFESYDVDRNSLEERNWFLRLVQSLFGIDSAGYRALDASWEKLAANTSMPMIHLWAEAEDATVYRERLLKFARWVAKRKTPPDVLYLSTWGGSRWMDGSRTPGGRMIPHNLPETDPVSHTALILEVAKLFNR